MSGNVDGNVDAENAWIGPYSKTLFTPFKFLSAPLMLAVSRGRNLRSRLIQSQLRENKGNMERGRQIYR
jgi:hypothetical protein